MNLEKNQIFWDVFRVVKSQSSGNLADEFHLPQQLM